MVSKLNMFRFRALHEKGEDFESWGWAPFLSEYDTEKAIEDTDVIFDAGIVFCMRYDVIKLPKALLKANVKKSCKLYTQEERRLPDRVVRKEIELNEAKLLRSRILPKTTTVEAFLEPSGELRVFCRQKAMLDRFKELFEQTLTLRLSRTDFAAAAMSHEGSVGELDMVHHRPIFSTPVGMVRGL